jgi:tetratricopeptide (TPR) repeat protein
MDARKLCILGIIAILVSCSSAPPAKNEVFEKRNTAARYLEFGNRYFKDVQYDPALRFYELAAEFYASVDDQEGLVTAHNSIGKVHFINGNLSTALTNYRKSYEISESIKNASLLLQSANNIGEVHIRRAENAEALAIFEKTLSTRDVTREESKELAVLYHNRGAVLRNMGRTDEALGETEKARALNLAAKRFEELASNYYLLSSIHSRRGDFPEALKFAELALDYDKKMENSLGIAQDLTAIGIILDKMEKTSTAHDMYKRAFIVYRALRHIPGMARTLEALESTSIKLGQNEEAEQYLEARKLLSR